MSDEAWTHVLMMAGAIIPVLLMWWDTRRTRDKQHMENQIRLGQIETMLEPIWNWWNRIRNGGNPQ